MFASGISTEFSPILYATKAVTVIRITINNTPTNFFMGGLPPVFDFEIIAQPKSPD
jgi:hypothetical protein